MKYTRRIQLTGGSTFTVSLPSKWVQRIGLNRGSEIDISEVGDTLILDPKSGQQAQKTKQLTLSKSVNTVLLERLLTSIYISYFDILTIRTEKLMDPQIRDAIKRFARRIMGVEIFEETSSTLVLQNVLNSNNFTIWNALRRMSLNVDVMISDAVKATVNLDNKMLLNIMERDDEVDRYSLYIFRETKASQQFEENNIYALILSRILERIADHTVNICKLITQAKYSDKRTLILISEFLDYSYQMYKEGIRTFYSNELQSMNLNIDKKSELQKKKDRLLSSIKNDKVVAILSSLSEEAQRIGQYSTDISELGMDYLLANENSFTLE